MSKPRPLDDEIGRKLAEAERSGELASARGYGRPLEADAGWDATPAELRMPFKILKDAGVAPPEIALFHERGRLRDALAAGSSDGERRALQQQLADLEQRLSLRLEALRVNGSL